MGNSTFESNLTKYIDIVLPKYLNVFVNITAGQFDTVIAFSVIIRHICPVMKA